MLLGSLVQRCARKGTAALQPTCRSTAHRAVWVRVYALRQTYKSYALTGRQQRSARGHIISRDIIGGVRHVGGGHEQASRVPLQCLSELYVWCSCTNAVSNVCSYLCIGQREMYGVSRCSRYLLFRLHRRVRKWHAAITETTSFSVL